MRPLARRGLTLEPTLAFAKGGALLLAGALLSGCATTPRRSSDIAPDEHCVQLTQLGQNFVAWTGTDIDIFRQSPVCYKPTDLPKYDAFFDHVNLLTGDVRVAVAIVQARKAGETTASNGKTYAEAAAMVAPMLAEAVGRAASAVNEGRGLVAGARGDFVGMNALKLPRIVKALNQSLRNLAADVTDGKQALSDLKSAPSTSGAGEVAGSDNIQQDQPQAASPADPPNDSQPAPIDPALSYERLPLSGGEARDATDRARDFLLQGDFRRAFASVSDAARGNSYGSALALRARLWRILGDVPNAFRDAESAAKKLDGSSKVEDMVAYGEALLVLGRAEDALATFEAALRIDSGSAEALAGRARVFYALGHYDKAAQDYDDLLKRPDQHLPLYYYGRAQALYQLSKDQDALSDLTNALRLNNAFYPAYGLVGAVLARKGDDKRALEAYNKAAKLNPQYSFAYLGRAALRLSQGDQEDGFADFGQAIRVDGHDFAPYFNRAEAYLRLDRKDDALEDYRKALGARSLPAAYAVRIGDRLADFLLWGEAIDAYSRAFDLAGGEASRAPLSPSAIDALLRRAHVWESLKERKKAMEDLNEAVERAPSEARAWAARGELALRMDQEEQAFSDLNQAVKLSPRDSSVLVARASYYSRTDKPKLAKEDLDTAIDADPSDADAYNARGALFANALNDNDKALADVLKAMSLRPQDPTYVFNLGMLRLKMREFSTALDAFNQALDLKGPPAPILAARAGAYSQMGDHTRALQDVQTALEKDPKFSTAFDTLGAMRLRTHEYEQAVRDLDQALLLDPENVSALIHRGRAYGALGSLRYAMQDFAKAAELDKHSKEAFTYLCQARRLSKDASWAVADCDRAIDIDQYYAPAYLQRGLCRLAAHQTDRALDDFSTLSALGVRDAEAYLAQAVIHAAMRQYRDAHNDYVQAMLIDPSAHSLRAGFAPAQRDLDDFFNAMWDLVEPVPKDQASEPYLFVARGDALANAQRYDKAVVEYTKSMELDGSNADAYAARGLSLMEQDALDASQQDFLKALELDPKNGANRVRLARALTLKGAYDKALAELVARLKDDPNDAEAYLRAGNIHYFQRHYDKALQDYLLAVKYAPGDAGAYNALGLGYFALRNYPLAIENFSKAIALEPDADRFYRNRAATYTNMKSYGNATAEYRNAAFLNIDPSLADEYKKLIDESQARFASSKD